MEIVDIKRVLKKIFILDKNRFEDHLYYYRRLMENKDSLLLEDSVISQTIAFLPDEIQSLNYKYYFINFNDEFFDTLYVYTFIIMIMSVPLYLFINPLFIIMTPLFYILCCFIINFIVTIVEISRLKKKLLEIYIFFQSK